MSTIFIPTSAPVQSFALAFTPPGDSTSDSPPTPTAADIWLRAGQVPLDRILMDPTPGTATEDDAADSRHMLGVNCELVNGILVAKTMGLYESQVAVALGYFLHVYLESHPIGVVAGEDGPYRLMPANVRKPDVSLILLDRFPNRRIPRSKVLPLAPDLAVEVLSEGNTTAEMELKLQEYFAAGVRLVWYIEPDARSIRVFTAADSCEEIRADGTLRGGDVLPGFELSLMRLFDKAGPRGE
jgi:Uma2 family endonuclease